MTQVTSRTGSSRLVPAQDDLRRWLPVLIATVEPDGAWTVRCPDCGRPNTHGPEVGYRSSHCKCEASREQREMDGYVIAPPLAECAPYPDFCAQCRNRLGRLKIYTPVDLYENSRGHITAAYCCDKSHSWECNWGDRARPDRPKFQASGPRCALYRHFDERGVLLYIGISYDPIARSKAHANSSRWVEFAARCEVVWCNSRAEAEYEERRAIQIENPVFNFTHALTPLEDRIATYLEQRARLF